MSTTKTVMTVSSLTMALLFGGGVYLFMNFGALAKHAAEKIASQSLGVPVRITTLDLSLQDKTASIKDIKISNPQNFKKPYAVTIGAVDIALGNVSKELIHFKEIQVTDTNVYLEVKENTTNLATIKNQMKSNPPPSTEEGTDPEPQIKVIIDRMAITGTQLNPSVTLLTEQDLEPVAVSDIILTGIGQRENGILARQAIAQIWNGVLKSVNKSANNAGFYQGMSPDALKDMGVSQIKQLKEQIKEDVKTLGNGIKGIFGGSE